MIERPLRVVVVYPDLLGTYGDGGNGLILVQRARWRGIEAELVESNSTGPLPSGDLYCLGGGEDGPQVRASEALRADGTFRAAVDDGAVVLAVCAGYQIVGGSFPGADGSPRPGIGLLDIVTEKGTGPRAVGEVLTGSVTLGDPSRALPALTGFENHSGITTLGARATPLGAVTRGVGNGSGGSEGAWSGRVVGTYLHGPVLPRNPALADVLLEWALGSSELAPLDDEKEGALRAERLRAARGRH